MKRLIWLVFVLGLSTSILANTVQKYSIRDSVDDAVEFLTDGSVSLHEQFLVLGEDMGGGQIMGLRFSSLHIPRGAQIVEAYVQFTATEQMNTEHATITISAETVSNTGSFSSTPLNLSKRPLLTDMIVWEDIEPWIIPGERAIKQRTPDLAVLIQTIVNQPDWRSGNALAFMFSGTGSRKAVSSEGMGQVEKPNSGPTLVVKVRQDRRYTVVQGMDDVVQRADGTIKTSDGDLDLSDTIGLRFQNIIIPQGSKVIDAYIQFTTSTSALSSDTFTVYVTGIDVDNASSFANDPFSLTSLAKTDSETVWETSSMWGPGLRIRTPSIAAQVREILNRNGWSAGGAMAFVLNGKGIHKVISYEGALDTDASMVMIPELVIVTGELTIHETVSELDDMEEYSWGDLDFDSSDLEMCIEEFPHNVFNDQLIGIRFPNVQIPQSALILDAYIQFSCDEPRNCYDPFTVRIFGIADSNTPAFTYEKYTVSSRPRTDTSIVWGDIPLWKIAFERGPLQRTPNLADIIQDIVSMDGWKNDNSLGFIIEGIEGARSAISCDGDIEAGNLYGRPFIYIRYCVDAE